MITVVIQAGGQSQRMGRDKALILLGGRPLIVHVLDRVVGLGDEILITTNQPQAYTAFAGRLVSDATPGAGALAGLHTALSAARGQTVLVLACDMPFVSRPLLAHMLSLASEADVVAPRAGGEYEPMHAVYARSCLPVVEAALQAGEERVISFYPKVRVRVVEQEELAVYDPAGLSFFNINTPVDLTRAEEILAGLG